LADVEVKKGRPIFGTSLFYFSKRVSDTVLHEGVDNEIINQFGYTLFDCPVEQHVVLVVGKN